MIAHNLLKKLDDNTGIELRNKQEEEALILIVQKSFQQADTQLELNRGVQMLSLLCNFEDMKVRQEDIIKLCVCLDQSDMELSRNSLKCLG